MIRPFIVDSERNLIEKGDLLGTMCYADQLVDTIKGVPVNQACAIGLYGNWGSGKSTIIRTAQQKLEEDREKSIKMVVYDAWKYSGDSFRRMFLLQMQNELGLRPTEEMKRFYTAITEEIKPNLELRKRGIVYIAIAIVLILIAVVLVITLKDNTEAKIRITLIFSVLSVLSASLGGNLFYELKVSQTQNILFAPEQFEECFRQMMKEVLKSKGWYLKKIYSHVQAFFSNEQPAVCGLDKLVIVIDNLDRCDTEVVYSMLTDIKTFLGTEKYDVVFVVPVDDEALKQHLFAKQEDDEKSMLKAEEFLRKFFNVVIRIKPHRMDDLNHYIHELNRDQKLGFNPNTLSLVLKEYAENPRRILQMLNNLTVEQSLYGEDFARENETLIAACMIIREHYPQMMSEILRNDTILYADSVYEYKLEEEVKDKRSLILPIELDTDVNFKSFMRMAKQTLQRASTADFRRIFTNTDNALSNLSDSLLQALNSYDSSEIVKYIQEYPSRRQDVMIEILRRIKEEDTHDADDAMVLWAECIAKINQEMPLHNIELQNMDDAFELAYDFVPRTVMSVEAVCKLAYDSANAGCENLKNVLFEFIRHESNNQYKPYHDYVKGVFETFVEKEDCGALRELAEDYMYNVEDISVYTFTDTQKRYLLTDSFIKKIIDGINTTRDEHQQKLLAWCLANLKDIQQTSYNQIFARLEAIVGNRDRKPNEQFYEAISFAMPILESIREDVDARALNPFFNSIVNKRITPTGQNRSIIDDADENQSRTIAEFCFEMYRVSGRNLSINPSLITLQKKCEKYVKERLILLQQMGVSLIPFRKNIAAFEEIDDAWYILIPVVFQKDANGARSDETTMKIKLQILYDKRDDERALELLVRLTEEEEICTLFVQNLDITDYDVLNNLHERLLPRIVSLYTESSAEQFKGNNAMLKIVLKQNAKNVEDIVTQTLIDRLNNGIDVDGTVDVIASHDKWHHRKNKTTLKAMLEGKMPDDEEKDVELSESQMKIKDVLNRLG